MAQTERQKSPLQEFAKANFIRSRFALPAYLQVDGTSADMERYLYQNRNFRTVLTSATIAPNFYIYEASDAKKTSDSVFYMMQDVMYGVEK